MHARILQLYNAGLAAGTWKNKTVQARKYTDFANAHSFNVLLPSQYDLMAYTLHLNDALASPGAVLNYMSGARTWVRLMGGDVSAFDAYPVALIKRGVKRTSSHVPAPAPPLTRGALSLVISYLRLSGPSANVLIAALLFGHATLLRQGNLLCGPDGARPGHAIAFRDVERTIGGITALVRSTKTRWRSAGPFRIVIPSGVLGELCPVAAWDAYVASSRPGIMGPAFVLPTGLPLLASTLVAALRLALGHAGVPNADAFSLHSLRRGGAQACAASGSSLRRIKELGAWSSSAVHAYVPRGLADPAP